MSHLIIKGPSTPEVPFDMATSGLGNDQPFELPDGRWGIKLCHGAIILPSSGTSTRAASIEELKEVASLRNCRLLPGNVAIVYEAPNVVRNQG